ncbi:MAG TPA: HU family DNA-binding protein [Anaerovoracaceae bacterium]|nr:HU family DNA-binding protein [Anaerovoracaceae bacterium]
MTDKPVEFLPDISQYLEQLESTKSVTAKGLEEIIYRMHASTGISKEACMIVIKIYFQEIRSAILRGDKVVLAGLGKFILASPKNSGNKKRVFPKFKPYKTLIKRMNNE